MIRFTVRTAFRTAFAAAFSLALIAAALGQSLRQDRGQDQAGQLDFYVLSLSWSPSFCAAAAERGGAHAGGPQCGTRPYSFVVHGLWPQYERGFPQYCQVPAPRLDRSIVAGMLDLMPAPRLVFNQWNKHGTCSGLSPRVYFATVRKARAVVTIPPEYSDLHQPLKVTPAAVEQAFIKANPDLSARDMAVRCDRKRLTEIRICLGKDLHFRQCPNVAAGSCRRGQLVMPPMRGG